MKSKDGIKIGDTFNAYVKEGQFSKTLSGKEAAGRLSFACPEVAIKITNSVIESEKCKYARKMFKFEKVPSKEK